MSEVVNNERARRFEITVDGRMGFLNYSTRDGGIDLQHTEVPRELGGRGIGGMLAKAAFEHARAANLRVTASCPFVRKYLERNSEYLSLVAVD